NGNQHSSLTEPFTKEKTLQIFAGPFYILTIKDRRQRERRNRRKNLWGNVSLLRGWQQHPRIDVVTYIISTMNRIIPILGILMIIFVNKLRLDTNALMW
ncbi:MAG: hypothetical protein K0S25_1544, partial [Bacillus sp. (in: firmicutes)]|nr:hypothetical protein [Bacillus sp. (in: firmicutes)]